MSADSELCPEPSGIQNFVNQKGFTVFHQNIRGLHGKKDIISDILYHNSKFDIFAATEIFILHKTLF